MHFYVTDETKETVTLNINPVNITEYTENAEWMLTDVTSNVITQHSADIARVIFKVERRSKFVVYTIAVPLITLTLISSVSFLLPVESGEKASLSVTVFLAYTFFVIIARDAMPHNAVNMSYYVVYLCGSLVLGVVNVVYVILESKIYHNVGDRKISDCFPYKILRKQKVHTIDVEQKQGKNKKVTKREKDIAKDNPTTWAKLLRLVDVVAFCIALVYLTVFGIVIFVYIHA